MNTTTARSLRQLTAYQVARRMRQAKVTQQEIADQLRCSQAVVSRVIRRSRGVAPALSARVWATLEAALTSPDARRPLSLARAQRPPTRQEAQHCGDPNTDPLRAGGR